MGGGDINLFPVLPVGGDNNINNHEQRVKQSTII